MVTAYNEGIYSTLWPCNHEEGNYRVLLHCENMSKEEVNQSKIFTVDTDAIVIATLVFSELSLLDLLIEFGKNANWKYIPIHEIMKSLGPKRVGCLTLFHSLTECDEVMVFLSFRKRTARKTWQNYPQLTEVLANCAIIQPQTLSKVKWIPSKDLSVYTYFFL